ncbi:MAG: alpha/beta hydrolase [Myxococcales bacterium]|nr:alpha/beta hydrolase [Myxococcales bacterium]MCB9715620.1 alpha/beta hydrolase [Myxococcales bacterium]
MPRAQVGDIELSYESMGEGPTVLLVMGLGAQLVLWPDDFCRDLVARGFRVVRFDNRDVGESSRLDQLPVPDPRSQIARWLLGLPVRAPYGLGDMADDAAGLLDALEVERAHVMGMSMGGMIAQLVAIRHPRRVLSLTSIMSNAGDRLSSISRPRALRALFRPLPRTREQAELGALQLFRVIGSPGFPFDEAGIRDRAGRSFERGTSPRGFMRQMAAVLAGHDRRVALRRLRVPALVVHGKADPLVPPRGGVRTARALPRSELLMIDGMGHDLPRGAWPRILGAFERVARTAR